MCACEPNSCLSTRLAELVEGLLIQRTYKIDLICSESNLMRGDAKSTLWRNRKNPPFITLKILKRRLNYTDDCNGKDKTAQSL